jgi:hypothetical protein
MYDDPSAPLGKAYIWTFVVALAAVLVLILIAWLS